MYGAAFQVVGLVVFIACEKISTPTCSAKFISTVTCQLLEINSNENQMSGHCTKTMTRVANKCRLRHGIHRIQWLSMLPDLNPIENV